VDFYLLHIYQVNETPTGAPTLDSRTKGPVQGTVRGMNTSLSGIVLPPAWPVEQLV